MTPDFCVALPHGAKGLSAVCVISWSYSLFLPESVKQIEFCNIFGMSNLIDAVIDTRDGLCVRFGDRIHLTVVHTHAKCGTRIQGELH